MMYDLYDGFLSYFSVDVHGHSVTVTKPGWTFLEPEVDQVNQVYLRPDQESCTLPITETTLLQHAARTGRKTIF